LPANGPQLAARLSQAVAAWKEELLQIARPAAVPVGYPDFP
jgi:hypothetical protein